MNTKLIFTMLFVSACNIMLLIAASAESPLLFNMERGPEPPAKTKQLLYKADEAAVLPGFYYMLPK